MARPPLAQVIRRVRKPAHAAPDVSATDQALLARFVASRDEGAFRALVQRHGATVLVACRQVLRDPADIDDAFQATFLVLLKKAPRLAADPAPLGGWLFAVAHRVAVRCRADRRRRTAREAEAVRRTDRTTDPSDLSWREAAAALHEELNALPEKYRLPLLLCGVRGLTRDEAAAELGTTVGALRGHLERGRALLEKRIARRGVLLSAGWLALVMGSARAADGPPRELTDLAVRLAKGSPSPTVAALATGAFAVIPVLKLFAAALTAAVFALGLTAGLVPPQPVTAHADDKPAPKTEKKSEPKPNTKTEVKERIITGRVIGHDGRPVKAELALAWLEGNPQPVGETGADGAFKVTVPMTRGDWGGWLVATAPGHGIDFVAHGSVSSPRTLTPIAEVTFRLPKERPVRGRLLDQQGRPVVGATVTANEFAVYNSDTSRESHFRRWVTDGSRNDVPPYGDREMWYADRPKSAGSPYTAVSDKDGRFEVAGVGEKQLFHLRVHGAGVANREIIIFNQDGFDPAPLNKAAKDSEIKGLPRGGKWQLYGVDPTVVLEPEKIIRGRVTGPEGKPRVGVTVAFTRPNKRDVTRDRTEAVTDTDGKYEIRGARKHPGYMVEVPADTAAGLIACQGFADDTAGYEPITINLKCAKGVIVSGTVRNKATREPVQAQLYAEVMSNNPFVEKYPPFTHSASGAPSNFRSDKDGRYRVVVIPGRVLLMAAAPRDEFRPPVPDPKYPDAFSYWQARSLTFYGHGGGMSFVQGNWCKVLETKENDTALAVDIDFEPAPKTLVKVVDTDGKPVTGAYATGITHVEFARPKATAGDTLTVYNLDLPMPEPKQDIVALAMGVPKEKPGRLLAVYHDQKKLVGTLTLTTADKNPAVMLTEPGSITGRVVGKDGKPLVGLTVHVWHARREVAEAFRGLNGSDTTVTDGNGEYRIDGLFPGQEFQLNFFRGQRRYDPGHLPPKERVQFPGQKWKMRELELEPTKDQE
ncbi:sigma-70 family RNA polymerase sigma factor [Gemmata sp. JC673]|uniref:Sigma-70 family RNA polymerase sigma factor n=1 Tax=Gemmata algarum TaxID=2975278 RepID=A0ABU5F570_9BACT|nr:sigma-70 family RNA polymerase sigma factor [Gemmata algarum]MDY3561885.1 sigma-70 family RNA polymerase sigma factor [Gemmata algarum]